MPIEDFIAQNQSRIQNMDGNLDTAVITIITQANKLAFYWFDNGVYSKHQVKE